VTVSHGTSRIGDMRRCGPRSPEQGQHETDEDKYAHPHATIMLFSAFLILPGSLPVALLGGFWATAAHVADSRRPWLTVNSLCRLRKKLPLSFESNQGQWIRAFNSSPRARQASC